MKFNCSNCKNIIEKKNKAYPYYTHFNKKNFFFLKCNFCRITSIYPKLNENDIKNLYGGNYHDLFYTEQDNKFNNRTLKILRNYINKEKNVLDYGCGNGSLLNKIFLLTKNIYGVDVRDTNLKKNTKKFIYYNFEDFFESNKIFFDVIILRDITEHLNDPKDLLIKLSNFLNKDGIIYIEGPLEKGFSLVNIIIHLNGFIKFNLKSNKIFKPYHLNLYSYATKYNFLKKIKNLKIIYAKTFETGWPYQGNGFIKNFIAKLSIILNYILNSKIIKFNYGNRFIIILKK